MKCRQELCTHWSGDGDVCPCAVFGMRPNTPDWVEDVERQDAAASSAPAPADDEALIESTDAPDEYGCVWVPVNTLPYNNFELLPEGEEPRSCRYTVGPGHTQCGVPSVARLRRGRRWWHYCGDHLYGCRIRNGVLECRVRRVTTEQHDCETVSQ